MALEIERKFLVTGEPWKSLPRGELMRQGYLLASREKVVRVRIEGDQATLTIKSGKQGITRGEWEYPLPMTDAHELLNLCDPPILEKFRYRIPCGELTWEIDVFRGDNLGLVVAEIELQSEDQAFDKPEWVGEEVTGDPRYLNSNLLKHPYSSWRAG